MNNNLNGLMGYYFEDNYFSDLNIIAPTNKRLDFNKDNLPDICLNKKIKSIRWIGYLKPNTTGEYTISTDCSNCILQINNKVLASSSPNLNTINLEAGKLYKVRIEQLLDNEICLNEYTGINLYWQSKDIEKQLIPQENLINPDFSDTSEENILIPDDNFFFVRRARESTRDTDRDGIPDDLEINGYTVINMVVTKWDDSYSAQGYKKYISNPYRARTANDPYTDFEKVSGRIDPSVRLYARNPMIAAYPIVRVAMEKLVVSKTSTITTTAGSNMSKTTTTETSNSDTAGVDISTQAGYNVVPNFSVTATAHYSHTWQTSNSVADTSGNSFTNGLTINQGQAAYLNPNVRYYNSGTAPVYNVNPNLTLTLDGDSLVTVQAQANQVGGYLNPDKYYPAKSLAPIAFNTMDQFNSHLISINYSQLQSIDKGHGINLSISQFNGEFAKLDLNGNLVTAGNNWGPYLGTIESTTASFAFDSPERVTEVRVAARNADDPTDATPIITIRRVLLDIFDVDIRNDEVYYHGRKLPNNMKVSIFIEEDTRKQLDAQLAGTNKKFIDCIVRPGMNIYVQIKNISLDIVKNGVYKISTFLDANKVIDIYDGDAIIYNKTSNNGQQWSLIYDAYIKVYRIYNPQSITRFLTWDSSTNKAIATNYDANNLSQQWILESSNNNSYIIRSMKNINKVLDLKGSSTVNQTNIIINEYTGNNNQKWKFDNPTNIITGTFQIVLKLDNNKALDVNNNNDRPNDVTVWDKGTGNNQKWAFEYNNSKKAYKIVSKINGNLVLAWNPYNNSKNVFATPFMGYDEHYWVLEKVDSEYYIFKNYEDENQVLDIWFSGVFNGNDVDVWPRNDTDAQKFKLLPV